MCVYSGHAATHKYMQHMTLEHIHTTVQQINMQHIEDIHMQHMQHINTVFPCALARPEAEIERIHNKKVCVCVRERE